MQRLSGGMAGGEGASAPLSYEPGDSSIRLILHSNQEQPFTSQTYFVL